MITGLPEVSPAQAGEALNAITGLDPSIALGIFFVVLARIIGFFMVAPFFGSMNIPMTVKVFMAATFAAVITPLVGDKQLIGLALAYKAGTFTTIVLFVNQILIGLAMGLVGAFVFYAIESAGRIINVQSGANMTDLVAPQTGERTSPAGSFYMMLALCLLVATGQHLVMIDALIDSLKIFPASADYGWVGSPLNGNDSFLKEMAFLSGNSLLITVKVAAPAMLSLMMADILLGIINRGAPQVNVFALSQVIKGPIAIAAMLMALGTTAHYITDGAIPSFLEGDHSITSLVEKMAKSS